MNKATLEREYSPSSCVSNYEELIKKYTQESINISNQIEIQKDLVYGINQEEKLDLCATDNPESPLVVFIHGGYWQLLSKDDCLFPAKHFFGPQFSRAPGQVDEKNNCFENRICCGN